jgi:AraC-like DNA-binding protein
MAAQQHQELPLLQRLLAARLVSDRRRSGLGAGAQAPFGLRKGRGRSGRGPRRRAPRLAHRSITEIALAWGFADAAHASRVFSAAYGVAPSRWRADRR